MQQLNISDKLKNKIKNFIQGLKDNYQDELVSVVLYGSAASNEFIEKHSNLNLLIILRNTDLNSLKKASRLVNKFRMISPLFLTEEYIKSSTDIFPIEFLDMQENYLVLFGKDVLKDIMVDTRNLRFQCEQELKVKLLNLKQLYLKVSRDKFALSRLLLKSVNSTLHILRNVLRLKQRKPPYLKQDILKELISEFQINAEVWEKVLSAKNKQVKLNLKDTNLLFRDFVSELERIVNIIDA